MEPRIATLLDQSPYKRLTLDPSVLTTSSSAAPRYNEPAAGVDKAPSNRDSRGHHDHAEARNKNSSQAHSSAPIARVLNDPASTSHTFQPTSGRQTPQHAAFHIRNDGLGLGSTISPDARRRDETHNSGGYSGGDNSLIQLPKLPQVPRKTAKRPRIPPLLQGLHQPPPLPPKSRLFPPITSDRSGLVSDVGDRFGLGNAFPTSNTEEPAKARVSPQKGSEAESEDIAQATSANSTQKGLQELGTGAESAADQPSVIQTTSQAHNKTKAPRKRTRWSQKETEDLLTGVSRFGIGRWKQILDCPDFQFQGRTAVDLKDRFRVCRPGEGLKARKAITPEGSRAVKPKETTRSDSEVTITPSVENVVTHPVLPVQRTTFEEIDSVGQAVTSKTEVHGPFLKSKRRARREFSDTDDKNLLKGFKRHGPVWHSMRDDFELGFGMRHPTDLRDRFRIRYPDLFAQAGYKLKPKERRAMKDRANEIKAQEAQVSRCLITTAGKTSEKSVESVACRVMATTPNVPSVTALMPVATTSQSESTRPTFDLITNLTFDDDDGDRSPIVLNRNILQWADENSSSAPPVTATPLNSQSGSHTSSDLLYNPFTASDGLHINPLATLKLPSTAHWSYMNLSTAAPPPSLPPPAPMKHPVPANGASTSTSRAQQDMRTPNLPNIVFPYVPNASARNAVHNLPAPADILSSGQAGTSDNYIWIG